MPSPLARLVRRTLPFLFATLSSQFTMASTFVYVSNAADGTLSSYQLDNPSGKLTTGPVTQAGPNVMPLAVHGNHLFAAVRSKPYNVQTFSIAAGDGQLTKISESPTPDSYAYISLDQTGRYLFGVSYDNDIVTVTPVAHGTVAAEPLHTLKTAQNAHSVRIDRQNRTLLVANLGGERVLQYHFDSHTGALTPYTPDHLRAPAGLGPRHLVFAPDNRYVYVLDELQARVISYALDAHSGQLTQVAVADSLPSDSALKPGAPRGPSRIGTPAMQPHADTSQDIWAADIHLTPDGKYLYTSERTSSVLAAFKVDQAHGSLTPIGTFATERQPRGFAITADSRHLICSGEKSQHISVFDIDPASGRLTLNDRYPVGNGANWVEIVDL
ncbi:lactonase family protein [Pseudomonas eucalypticola]|uniref:Beta-propeller fold lactonase family protein n=1 Tax=Pseudomonas eucalypticola TaxID=2599595 RepID=A0A7D5HGX8_9PSED|nr:beta-propeller fold lactonase family protein [Pseudomonas eucalypticola]QKZ04986.1 beta-propeller fold lactonase family protein [Pseudomonas eucalypticola]